MNSNDLWDKFLQSGQIADYLQYRETLQAELALEPLAEDGYASEYGRNCNPGTQFGGK